jgi:hypothetical protein
MQYTDYLVIAVIALIALAPLAGKVVAAARAVVSRPGPAPLKAPAEGWQAGWVQTLMQLQSVLERDGKNSEAVKLNRELIWLILGGDSK